MSGQRQRRTWPFVAMALGFLTATGPGDVRAEPLVVDLSSHLIAITSSYSGAELVLFGARKEAGDVVVVVRSPGRAEVVRHKTRVGGIWVNSSEATFENVPGFYAVAASQSLSKIAAPAVLASYEIGVNNLRMEPRAPHQTAEAQGYKDALIRNRRRARLYQDDIGEIVFISDTLFRTDIEIPAHAPVGTYWASFYLFRDGVLISRQSRPLTISKVGFERAVFDFARHQPAAYGLIAVLLAVLSGWLAATMFRRT